MHIIGPFTYLQFKKKEVKIRRKIIIIYTNYRFFKVESGFTVKNKILLNLHSVNVKKLKETSTMSLKHFSKTIKYVDITYNTQ